MLTTKNKVIMKTIALEIYKFDELSDDAKEYAYDKWLNSGYWDFPYQDEHQVSLKAFIDIFPVKQIGRNDCTFEMTCNDEIAELSGVRLLKYLNNNYYSQLYKGKWYSTPGQWVNGKYHYKSRRSKCTFESDCPMTGYGTDYILLQPIYDFIAKPDAHTTFEDLMSECASSYNKGFEDEYEARQTMEYFIDMAEANDYDFTEDGTMY